MMQEQLCGKKAEMCNFVGCEKFRPEFQIRPLFLSKGGDKRERRMIPFNFHIEPAQWDGGGPFPNGEQLSVIGKKVAAYQTRGLTFLGSRACEHQSELRYGIMPFR